MADRLTARQALDRAAEYLAEAERLQVGDCYRPECFASAQAYSTYAQAAAVVDGTIDVRARVESGI